MASHLVTSELEWPFIFELWPRVPHKWRYNILPFIPSPNQSRLNFAPEAFHRNAVQQTLSFDLLKYQDKKVWGLFQSILSWFYLCLWLNTSCEGQAGWLQMLVVFVLIQLWRVTKAGKKTEKVWRIITGQVNKHLSVVRKETLSFYKADFLQSC